MSLQFLPDLELRMQAFSKTQSRRTMLSAPYPSHHELNVYPVSILTAIPARFANLQRSIVTSEPSIKIARAFVS